MVFFLSILKAIFFTPMYNLLVGLYAILPNHDIGLAIILLTAFIKLITIPLTASSLKSQKALQDLQPKLKELQLKYKDNKEQLAKETMALYSAEKVNPLASCLPILLQLPFLIALYQVLKNVLASEGFEVLYPFVPNPGSINPISFGIINLSTNLWVLAIVAGLSQFWQAHTMTGTRPPKPVEPGAKDEDMLAMMNKQMKYMMPLMTTFIAWKLPAGLALYWITMNLLAVAQQLWLFRRKGSGNL